MTDRERELLAENARIRNELLALRRKAAAWDAIKAEASYSDAFLVRWMREQFLEGLPLGEAHARVAPLLGAFRNFRELQRRAGREQEEADQEERDSGHDSL